MKHAPVTFTSAQLRAFLKLAVQVDYNFLEKVADHFAIGDEHDKSEGEIIIAALDATADNALTGFALRPVLTDHVGIPQDGQPDLLTDAAGVFAPKASSKNKPKPTLMPKESTPKKRKAA